MFSHRIFWLGKEICYISFQNMFKYAKPKLSSQNILCGNTPCWQITLNNLNLSLDVTLSCHYITSTCHILPQLVIDSYLNLSYLTSTCHWYYLKLSLKVTSTCHSSYLNLSSKSTIFTIPCLCLTPVTSLFFEIMINGCYCIKIWYMPFQNMFKYSKPKLSSQNILCQNTPCWQITLTCH